MKAALTLRSIFLATACGFATLLGCTTTSRVTPRATVPPPEFPVIVRLVGRTHSFTIRAGPAAALYSAQAADGTIIVNNVTIEELRANHPELYERLRPFVATDTTPLIDNSARE